MISAPGVYDGITTGVALSQGFIALYMTGTGTTMACLDIADLGLSTLNDMLTNAEAICQIEPTVAVIADADTGYCGPVMVDQAYARAGEAALHIEDQVQKRCCCQLLGTQLINGEQWFAKLRDSVGSDILLIVRTDANAGLGFDEATVRLQGADACGVDVLFFETLESVDECSRARELFAGTPMLLNMVPASITPNMTVNEAHALGFQIIIWPGVYLEPICGPRRWRCGLSRPMAARPRRT